MDLPDKEAHVTWLHALYGATMLAVQQLEPAISLVYAVANVEPGRHSNASPRRQWRNATARTWRAFQQGTAGMKLNDAKVGIKDHLAPELYRELDAFITGPRNQLAHRFLIERVPTVDRDGMPALAASAADLIKARVTAKRLSDALMGRADEIRSAWPDVGDIPPEIREQTEAVARATLMKQFPAEFIAHAEAASHERDESTP
jgi:hypothetical protein